EKDYWRKNLSTYRDARVPDIRHVALHLDLYPERGRYRARGTYDLVNGTARPLREVLLTGGAHWERLPWTLEDQPYAPHNRAHLYVFTPPGGLLSPGRGVRIGFEHEGAYPRGIGKRAASAPEFILPSAVVLTSFGTSIVPVLGFRDSVGVDDENLHDSQEFPDDFYNAQTDSFRAARRPFTARIPGT